MTTYQFYFQAIVCHWHTYMCCWVNKLLTASTVGTWQGAWTTAGVRSNTCSSILTKRAAQRWNIT